MKRAISTLLISFISILLLGQISEVKNLLELPHIKVDEIIYYQQPFKMVYNKPEDNGFKPDWYNAYCVTSYPKGLEYYEDSVMFYVDSIDTTTKEQLLNFKTRFEATSLSDFRLPFRYCYGEIILSSKINDHKFLILLKYDLKEDIANFDCADIDLLQIEARAKGKKNEALDSCDIYFPVYTTIPGYSIYSIEDGIVKNTDQHFVLKSVLNNKNQNLFVRFNHLHDFKSILDSIPEYTRSKIVNGQRTFETIKNIPAFTDL